MPVTVEQVRFFKNMVILKFKEMNRIEDQSRSVIRIF